MSKPKPAQQPPIHTYKSNPAHPQKNKNNRPWPTHQGQPRPWPNSSSQFAPQHPHPGPPQSQSQNQTASPDEKLVLKAMHERMVWFIISLVVSPSAAHPASSPATLTSPPQGLPVTATTKSGQQFQGLLSSAVTEAEFCITLKRAVEVLPATAQRPQPPVKPTLIILAKELVDVVAADVDLSQASSLVAPPPGHGVPGFKTDAETSIGPNGLPNVREKELQTWQPTPTLTATDTIISSNHQNTSPDDIGGLEDSLFPKTGDSNNRRTFDKPWDQFEANEKLFGTKTDFDEEIYTTKLDRSAKDFKERERKAEAIAREIMASTSNNIHVQEERGIISADDSGMNEEDK